MEILKELAASAKADGESMDEWLSTLKSCLILMLQQGRLPAETDINQMLRDAPEAFDSEGEKENNA